MMTFVKDRGVIQCPTYLSFLACEESLNPHLNFIPGDVKCCVPLKKIYFEVCVKPPLLG